MSAPDDELDPRLKALLQDTVPPVDPGRRARLWKRVKASVERQGGGSGARVWVLAAVVLAALVLAWIFIPAATEVGGSLDAKTRTTVAIGDRAVAVVEAESSIAWTEAKVTQDRGAVFYRVDAGPPFEVETPAGSVRVVGTSFEVEVTDMKNQWKSATVGAAIAAAVVVTVYEGKVVLASDTGSVEVGAGEQARANAGATPTAVTPRRAEAKAAQLARGEASSESQAELVRALRGRVAELEAQVGDPDPEAVAAERAERHARSSARLFDPSREQILEDAESCRVRYFHAPVEMHGDPPKLELDGRFSETWTKVGLSDKEAEVINKFYADVNAEMVPLLKELYVDATGDDAGAENLSYKSIRNEIMAKSDDLEARRQVTRERAGLQAPSDDPSSDNAAARLHRAHFDITRRYNEVMMSFGKDRGLEIRNKIPLHTTSYGGCER